MEESEGDIQLKFDGPPIERVGGAPADAVINALSALQRMVHLVGMREEGYILRQRVKPSAHVRNEYALICKPSISGSHIQPFEIASSSGVSSASAILARNSVLSILSAFSSGEAKVVEELLPDPRERWFMAEAASGLLPSSESGIQVTINHGKQRVISFEASRARFLIESFSTQVPVETKPRRVTGRVTGADFDNFIISLRPLGNRAFRLNYPDAVEDMLQANRRKRIAVVGIPTINNAKDVTGFAKIDSISELEHVIEEISHVKVDNGAIYPVKPYKINATYDCSSQLFFFQDSAIGIDSYSETYNELRQQVLDEISFMWLNYAMEDDEVLDEEAFLIKTALLDRFYEAEDAA